MAEKIIDLPAQGERGIHPQKNFENRRISSQTARSFE
jgi:hypothetical protein